MRVLAVAMNSIWQTPAPYSAASDSQKLRLTLKSSSISVQATLYQNWRRPLTWGTTTSESAPDSAPRPSAAIRKPKPVAPTCSTFSAKSGISVSRFMANIENTATVNRRVPTRRS